MSLLLARLSTGGPGDAVGVCAGIATVLGVGEGLLSIDGVGTCAGLSLVIGYGEDAATTPDTTGGSRSTVRTRSLSVSTRFWPVPDYHVY